MKLIKKTPIFFFGFKIKKQDINCFLSQNFIQMRSKLLRILNHNLGACSVRTLGLLPLFIQALMTIPETKKSKNCYDFIQEI